MTFRDIINKENAYMEDEEDDSDWEPLPSSRAVETSKWICTNCTMANLDYAVHCGVCFILYAVIAYCDGYLTTKYPLSFIIEIVQINACILSLFSKLFCLFSCRYAENIKDLES